jgi:PTH1 family peptidyl-tRNA hydrolase
MFGKTAVKIIVGLGNPGPTYAATWHNLGFVVLDALRQAESFRFGDWTSHARGAAEVAFSLLPQTKLALAKPQKFMNASGPVVAELMRSLRLRPEELWVIHDDGDLPLGKLRISANASAGGHRGVQSIIDALGTAGFIRFRLGINTPQTETVPMETYVLQPIPPAAQPAVSELTEKTLHALEVAQLAGIAEAMNQYN